MRLYIDGIKKASKDLGGKYSINYATSTKTLIGAETDAYGNPTEGWYLF
jgi:hypothetical protein